MMQLRITRFALAITLFSASPWAKAQATPKEAVPLAVPEAEDPKGAASESQLKPPVVKKQQPLSHSSQEKVTAQPDSPKPIRTKTEWYGGWILGLDGLAILTTPALIGVGVYALAGPLVHVNKGQPGRAVGSLALRVGLPLAFAGTVAAAQHECDPYEHGCGLDHALNIMYAGGVGALAAMIIDSSVLAYRDVPVKPKRVLNIDYAPSVAVTQSSAVFSLSGTF